MVDIRIRRSIVAIPIPKTTVQAIVPVTANPSNSLKKKQKPATSTHQIPFYKIKKTASKADNRSRRSSVATPRPKTTAQASVPATANPSNSKQEQQECRHFIKSLFENIIQKKINKYNSSIS